MLSVVFFSVDSQHFSLINQAMSVTVKIMKCKTIELYRLSA